MVACVSYDYSFADGPACTSLRDNIYTIRVKLSGIDRKTRMNVNKQFRLSVVVVPCMTVRRETQRYFREIIKINGYL